MISCVDAHTAGEPIRVVTSGFPRIYGKTMMEKRAYVLEHLDHYRKFLMREPRGHAAMYGAIIGPPVTEDGDLGVLFIENGGMGTMCGHGTIGVSKVVFDTGILPAKEGVNSLKLDVPAGRVVSFVEIHDGVVDKIYFNNVPAFLYKSDLKVPVKGVGDVLADVCFGGAFYIFVEAAQLGLEVKPENVEKLKDFGMEIRKTVSEMYEIVHPENPDIHWIYGTVLMTLPQTKDNRLVVRNVCIFGDAEVDRSPCGTGTCARMAQLYAKGVMKPGMILENHSIIDTVFEGSIIGESTIAGHPAILPQVSGMAWISGFNNLLLEKTDPMMDGFVI